MPVGSILASHRRLQPITLFRRRYQDGKGRQPRAAADVLRRAPESSSRTHRRDRRGRPSRRRRDAPRVRSGVGDRLSRADALPSDAISGQSRHLRGTRRSRIRPYFTIEGVAFGGRELLPSGGPHAANGVARARWIRSHLENGRERARTCVWRADLRLPVNASRRGRDIRCRDAGVSCRRNRRDARRLRLLGNRHGRRYRRGRRRGHHRCAAEPSGDEGRAL